MRIAFLHIGDIHISRKGDTDVSNIEKIADALGEVQPFDKICIIITGDVANSGTAKQYSLAYGMLMKIKKQISKKYHIKPEHILVVPGNHDVNLHDSDLGHDEINKKLKAGVTEEDISEELEKQRNYFNFANGLKCVDADNKLYCVKTIDAGDKTINVGLINSALFSTLGEDKGLHYLPDETLNQIKSSLNADFNIVAFHHAHHWMTDAVKNKLDKILMDKANIVFCGHEHEMHLKTITENKDTLIYLTGGILADKGDWEKSEFYIDVIDTEKSKLSSYKFSWVEKQDIYFLAGNESFEIRPHQGKSEFALDEDFEAFLNEDSVNMMSESVFDYYIFPDIERAGENNNRESKRISSEEDFIEVIEDVKTLYIMGGSEFGKTLLLKKMFLALNNKGYTCIYCNAENIKNLSIHSFKQKVFRSNYNDMGYGFDKYMQMPSSKRVALLDDIHEVEKESLVSLLKYIKSYCDIVICASEDGIELDLRERIIQNFEAEQYQRFKILPMYLDKRKKLIKKIVEIKDRGGDHERIVDNIMDIVVSQRKMHILSPSFVIQFTDYYLKNFRDRGCTDSNIFSKAFEGSITNRLSPEAKFFTVDKLMILLDKFAYWCFVEKRSDIPEKAIMEVVASYNEINGDVVSIVPLLEACINSKIIIHSSIEGHYRFSDKNVMSYFIAREINRRWNDERYDKDFEYCIKYIKYGINSNILLFITYLTDNLQFIRQLLDRTLEYTKDWDCIDIENVNVPYLASLNGQIEMKAPTQKDKEKNEQQEAEIDKEEMDAILDEKIKIKDYFDTDTDDSEEELNQVFRGMVLLDVVSKCLPGFEHRLNKTDKDKILDIIFRLPGQLFYIWAQQVEEDRDEMLQYLLQEYRAMYLKEKDWDTVKKEDMLWYLQQESISLLLDLINVTIRGSCKEYTIRYYEKYDADNKPLYNIALLMAYCKLDYVPQVMDLLKKLDKSYDKSIPVYMKRRVIYRFLITSKKIQSKGIQNLISRYFDTHKGNTTYRDLLIKREKHSKR